MAEQSTDLYKVRNRETLRRLDTGMEITRATKPIIDFLAHDAVLNAYVAEFVPDPHVSREQKESVYLRDGTDSARRATELLSELSSILDARAPIVKVAHAGRDSFDFYAGDGTLIQLHESPSPQFSFDIYAAL